jgi:hypothetical protein
MAEEAKRRAEIARYASMLSHYLYIVKLFPTLGKIEIA